MEFDYEMLRSRIRERFLTEENFAREMRMPIVSLRQKLRNEGDFTRTQIIKAAALLDIDAIWIPKYFFVERVQKNELFVECMHRDAKRRSGYVH